MDEPTETHASDAREDERGRLQAALEEKSREVESLRDRYLRAVADLENYRKRAQREREELIRAAEEGLLYELLAVLDNFERALGAPRDSQHFDGFVSGVELIHQQLLKVLEKSGVVPFSSVGQPFDPERHEAVMRVETREAEGNTVLEEMRRGYVRNGRVLRPAQVTVAVSTAELPADGDRAVEDS